jgi:5-oxoprolinase (ATP-hydrolysing) subunit A
MIFQINKYLDTGTGPSPSGGGREGAFIDINCDLGEGMPTDKSIMPFISSANIACGYHAGDEKTIWKTIELAIEHKLAIGAHISFLDKDNFGRTEKDLPADEVYELVTQQLFIITELLDSFDATLHHIKPHGALYNQSAKNSALAEAVARAVRDFNKDLILFGLSGSHSISEAKKLGLKTGSEVFADRSYQDDGTLTPRSEPYALIEDAGIAIAQVLQMIQQKTVKAYSGKDIPIVAETICIHGDGKNAVEFASMVRKALEDNEIAVQAL